MEGWLGWVWGWKQPLAGQLALWGRTWIGREHGCWGRGGCQLAEAVPRPCDTAEQCPLHLCGSPEGGAV